MITLRKPRDGDLDFKSPKVPGMGTSFGMKRLKHKSACGRQSMSAAAQALTPLREAAEMQRITAAPAAELQPGTYIRQHQLLAIVPFSAATLWRKIAAGTFVAPIKFSERCTVWEADSVRQWLEARKAEAGQGRA